MSTICPIAMRAKLKIPLITPPALSHCKYTDLLISPNPFVANFHFIPNTVFDLHT